MNMQAYACINKEEETREKSSSGGVFAVLARKVLRKNGVVFAVKYDKDLNAVHYRIDTELELEPAYGSKYLQSKPGTTFRKIRELLSDGRLVMFVGTPCQCAGLLGFLQKPQENLVCVDLFCHGVPSGKVLRNYLETLDNKQIRSINMRDKSSGWSGYNYSWNIVYEDGTSRCIGQRDVNYMKGFVGDLYLRPSCYACRFKRTGSGADITLGDFWGAWNVIPELDDNKGISAVLVHTDKGRELLSSAEEMMSMVPADAAEIARYNPSLVKSAVKTDKRDEFFRRFLRGEKTDVLIRELVPEKKQTSVGNAVKKLKGLIRRFKS